MILAGETPSGTVKKEHRLTLSHNTSTACRNCRASFMLEGKTSKLVSGMKAGFWLHMLNLEVA